MSSAFRTIALTIGTLFIAACSSDKQVAEDVLAEDSTLALEVMSARPDSVLVDTAELAPSNTTPPNTAPSTSVAVNVEPAPIAQPSSPVRTRSVRRAAPPKSTARLVIAPQKKRISRVRASRASTSSIVEEPRRAELTPLKSSALLPAGTELSLTADQRICASMSRVGDTFATRTATDVVGPIGVVIPKGTPALAQISSVNRNLDVDLMSIDVQGRSYTFASDVTHTDVERVRRKSSVSKSKVAAGAGIGAVAGGVIGGNPATTVLGAAAGGLAGAVATRRPAMRDECVPEGGRIDVKLTEPLRVSLSD